MRKRALRGAVVLALVLSLFTAPMASAADAPARSLAGAWMAIEAWFDELLAGWFSPEPVESIYAADQQCPSGTVGCPAAQDGGGGGISTTDGAADSDPDG